MTSKVIVLWMIGFALLAANLGIILIVGEDANPYDTQMRWVGIICVAVAGYSYLAHADAEDS